MKAIGVVRRIDSLGRIVIPAEVRRVYGFKEKETLLEMHISSAGQIILQKYEPGCVFCGEISDLNEVNGKRICPACMKKMVEECA